MAYKETRNPGRKPAVTDVVADKKYTNIAAAATTDIKDGGGRLHNIVINGGTLTGTITIYDENGTGTTTKIGTIAANQVVGMNFPYDCNFKTGLRITSSANVDFTVIWT